MRTDYIIRRIRVVGKRSFVQCIEHPRCTVRSGTLYELDVPRKPSNSLIDHFFTESLSFVIYVNATVDLRNVMRMQVLEILVDKALDRKKLNGNRWISHCQTRHVLYDFATSLPERFREQVR